MKTKLKVLTLGAAVSAMVLTGCQYPNGEPNNTASGALIGGAMGAIAGAAASTIGVLATRGHATEVYPETPVTFRTLEPVTINTEQSGQAFQPVRPTDYESNRQLQQRTVQVVPRPAPWWYSGYGYGYGYPYYYPGYFWGPSVGLFYGGGYWGGRGYYRGGGWGRRWR